MAIEEGYARFACDRSPKVHPNVDDAVAFLHKDDKQRDDWVQISHTDSNGVTINYTLCPECAAKYASVKETWDRDFREFAEEGR